MPVKPVDFRTKTLELAKANGWKIKPFAQAPSPPMQDRHLLSRNAQAWVVSFTSSNAFAFAHSAEETINRYVVLEQILTAPEDSDTVVTKAGELTGFTVRHEMMKDEGSEDEPGFSWPTMITSADHITAQRYSAETTEWYTVGSAMAHVQGQHRWWGVVVVSLGGTIVTVGKDVKMTERDMRRAVVAILREMC